MTISLIAAVDENLGLGKDNNLLCHLPADLKHFKQLTVGKTVIMGRKTFQSIGRPLPLRKNIVLSKQTQSISGVDIAHSLQAAFSLVDPTTEIMVIGGEAVFYEALPFASQVFLTLIHHQFEADVFFPKLDSLVWQCVDKTFRPLDDKNPYDLTFFHYHRL